MFKEQQEGKQYKHRQRFKRKLMNLTYTYSTMVDIPNQRLKRTTTTTTKKLRRNFL